MSESQLTPSEQIHFQKRPHLLPFAFVVCVVVAIGGGLLTGYLVGKFGMVGGAVLWLSGAFGGLAARKLTRSPSLPFACALMFACLVALALSEASYLRWWVALRGDDGLRSPTWLEAVRLSPTQLRRKAPDDLAMCAVFVGLGLLSAYLLAGEASTLTVSGNRIWYAFLTLLGTILTIGGGNLLWRVRAGQSPSSSADGFVSTIGFVELFGGLTLLAFAIRGGLQSRQRSEKCEKPPHAFGNGTKGNE